MRRILPLLFALVLSHAAQAVGPENPVLGPNVDYQQAVKFIKQEQYAMAIPLLQKLDAAHPNEPEVLNWLGFSFRKLKDYPAAKKFYDAALAVEPTYRPALEYQGMWFIETGDIPSAKANLEKLRAICASCEETADLVEALKKAGH
ncbi:MAG: tetratricopeptide repeat protein [Beijerinckiaceae bacterium]